MDYVQVIPYQPCKCISVHLASLFIKIVYYKLHKG